MEINVIETSGVPTVVLSGDLDVYSIGIFKEKFSELSDSNEGKIILVDCENLNYIDSSGLGAFISLVKKSRSTKGDVRLFHVNEDVQKILELTRIMKFMKPYLDARSALEGK